MRGVAICLLTPRDRPQCSQSLENAPPANVPGVTGGRLCISTSSATPSSRCQWPSARILPSETARSRCVGVAARPWMLRTRGNPPPDLRTPLGNHAAGPQDAPAGGAPSVCVSKHRPRRPQDLQGRSAQAELARHLLHGAQATGSLTLLLLCARPIAALRGRSRGEARHWCCRRQVYDYGDAFEEMIISDPDHCLVVELRASGCAGMREGASHPQRWTVPPQGRPDSFDERGAASPGGDSAGGCAWAGAPERGRGPLKPRLGRGTPQGRVDRGAAPRRGSRSCRYSAGW